MGTDLPVCSLHGVWPASCLGKLLQEAHQQPITCSSYPLAYISVTLKSHQNARCTHAHLCNPICSEIWTPSTPSTKSADSLKYNMVTGFTGWCSSKAGVYSSPGKILPAELFQLTRSMLGASEKHRHNPRPASTQKQK